VRTIQRGQAFGQIMRYLYDAGCRSRRDGSETRSYSRQILDAVARFPSEQFVALPGLFTARHVKEYAKHRAANNSQCHRPSLAPQLYPNCCRRSVM
jgi:hypothetical protein